VHSLHHNPTDELCLNLRFLGILSHQKSVFFKIFWTSPRTSTGRRVILFDAVRWHRVLSKRHVSVEVQLQFSLLQPILEDIRFVSGSERGIDSIVVSLIELRIQGDVQRSKAKDLEPAMSGTVSI
jgi:hypothetical protein